LIRKRVYRGSIGVRSETNRHGMVGTCGFVSVRRYRPWIRCCDVWVPSGVQVLALQVLIESSLVRITSLRPRPCSDGPTAPSWSRRRGSVRGPLRVVNNSTCPRGRYSAITGEFVTVRRASLWTGSRTSRPDRLRRLSLATAPRSSRCSERR
jgi:hypothetical protein